MKKLVAMMLCLMMLLTSAALAEGMGVRVIGGPAMETEPVSLDDIKMNVAVTIDGYGTLTPTGFSFIDQLVVYQKDHDWYSNVFKSGADADYALLNVDILNITTTSKNYISSCEVKAVYDDLYEYGGWFYQYNWNNQFGQNGATPTTSPINAANIFSIDPMYAGHYCFGCTLPNAVVEGKGSLKLVITIDGNEITYNVRK